MKSNTKQKINKTKKMRQILLSDCTFFVNITVIAFLKLVKKERKK